MIVLYRIEHNETELGVFKHNVNYIKPQWNDDRLKALELRTKELPTPYTDKILKKLKFNKDYYCGFKSLRQYKYWFKNNESKILINEYNFSLYEITVKTALIGDKQIAFKKDDIISKVKININDYNK